jgi:dTDP-4-amino-4,6-dideoxygalactose transaminase
VITTPFTFFATAGTIHNAGATPVFVDIDPDTFNILPEAAAAARTSRTKSCIPVDLFGQMAPVEAVMSALPGIPVIEDAAQTIGARGRSMASGVWPVRSRRSGRSVSSRRRTSAAMATAA